MNNIDLSFGQRIDETNGLVECWFTHGCLDWIKEQDWSDKNIIMFGAGLGDVWLAKRCKDIVIIERNLEWIERCIEIEREHSCTNINYIHRPCNDSSGMDKYYLEIPNGFEPDVIISDDSYRTEAVDMAIKYFKNKQGGGVLICDNYWQDYVWKSPIAIEWLEPFEKLIFPQPDHTDFEEEGCEWKTAIHFIK